jgi:hypothetical protein
MVYIFTRFKAGLPDRRCITETSGVTGPATTLLLPPKY